MTKNGIFAKLPKNFTRELIDSSEIKDEISAFIDYLMDREDKKVRSKSEYQNRWRLLNSNGNKLSRGKTLALIAKFEEAILNMEISNEFHKDSYVQKSIDTFPTDERHFSDSQSDSQNITNSVSIKEHIDTKGDTFPTNERHFSDRYLKTKDLKTKDNLEREHSQNLKISKDNLNELKVEHLPKSLIKLANFKNLDLEEELAKFKIHYLSPNAPKGIIDYFPKLHIWLINAKKRETNTNIAVGKNNQFSSNLNGLNDGFISKLGYKNKLDFIRSESRKLEKLVKDRLGVDYLEIWDDEEFLKINNLGSAKINVENGGKDVILFPLSTIRKEDIEILDVEVINV